MPDLNLMLATAKSARLPLAWRAFFIFFYALLACFMAFLIRDLPIFMAMAAVVFVIALPFVGTRRMREMRGKREWILTFCAAFLLRIFNLIVPFAVLKIAAAIFFVLLIAAWIFLARALQQSKRGLPTPGKKMP